MELITSILFFTSVACQDYLVRQVETRPEHATVSMQTEQHAMIQLNGAHVWLQCEGGQYRAWMVVGNDKGMF